MEQKKRLIDANALMNEVDKSLYENPHTTPKARAMHNHEHNSFINMIIQAHTVDAVEVVRCEDCTYRHTSEFCECRPADGFCNDGERKGNGTEKE